MRPIAAQTAVITPVCTVSEVVHEKRPERLSLECIASDDPVQNIMDGCATSLAFLLITSDVSACGKAVATQTNQIV